MENQADTIAQLYATIEGLLEVIDTLDNGENCPSCGEDYNGWEHCPNSKCVIYQTIDKQIWIKVAYNLELHRHYLGDHRFFAMPVKIVDYPSSTFVK